jgi:5-methylthioadenosine/S-adenosylhomocysteine deaminase
MTVLRADAVLTLDPQGQIYRPGFIAIEEDRIVEVGTPSAGMQQGTIDLGARLIMPGLVNAHTHTPMVLFRGLSEGHSLLNFEGWYNTIRVVEEVMTPDMVPPAVAVSCAEMLRTGTTTFGDQYFYMDQIVPVVRQSGMRAALAYGIVELGDEVARERELAHAGEFLASIADDPMLDGWVGPHAFFVDNSEETMRGEMALTDRYDTGLHIHLSTTGEEDDYCQQHYGVSAVQQMEQMGIFEWPVLAAHCLSIPESDFALLANRPFSAVIAASAGMRAGAGAAPLRSMLDAGINAAIGTDNVTNNNSYDLFIEMQIIGKVMSLREKTPGAIPAETIVRMATLGGARALGIEHEIGSLVAGKKADLIALDLNEIGWGPARAQDIYTALVYGISGMHVTDTMVNGQWLLRDRAWTTLDYRKASTELDGAYAALQERLEAQRQS